MNNEPIAWMSQGGDVSRSADYFEEMGFKDLIPLYTHPVKEQLTDEEIDNIVRDFFGEVDSFYDFRLVIRRCIRKAQEK